MAKILLVGSDESVQQMFEDILTANGFDVVVDNNAKDALDRLAEEFFPACVVTLTREESLWFLIKVRANKTVKVSSVPIVTLVDEPDKTSEFIEAGATKCISGFPQTGEALVKELKSILLPKFNSRN